MTTKLEQYLSPSLFTHQLKTLASTTQEFSYENELEELIDLAGEQFSIQNMKAALILVKGNIDEAYDLLLSGDEITLPQQEKVKEPSQEKSQESKRENNSSTILYLLRSIFKFPVFKIQDDQAARRNQNKLKQRLRFKTLNEKTWFEGKSGLQAKREKKPILKEIRIFNYNYFRKRFRK